MISLPSAFKRAFISIEAFASLAFATAFFSLALISFSSTPPHRLELYQLQLAEDIAEVSVKSGTLSEGIRAFARGGGIAGNELEGNGPGGKALEREYSEVIGRLGDYCLKVEVSGRKIEENCRDGVVSTVQARRIVFDGENFVELRISLGFYS